MTFIAIIIQNQWQYYLQFGYFYLIYLEYKLYYIIARLIGPAPHLGIYIIDYISRGEARGPTAVIRSY